MDVVTILLANIAVTTACFFVLWRIAIHLKDPSFIDSWWALGMVVTALVSFALRGGQGLHAALLAGLCAAWGLRLGLYLLWRWRKHGADRRYKTMMGKAEAEKGWKFPEASLRLVFLIQAPLQLTVSLPVMLGAVGAGHAIGPAGIAGAVLAVLGIGFESLGDWQLTRFKADPDNAGKVLDTGLWRYTRHPNYFGDCCVWWGLWLIAADASWIGALAIPGPVLITFLLTRWSGIPTVEGRMRRKRPEYEAYVARTSSFVPMPPKKA